MYLSNHNCQNEQMDQFTVHFLPFCWPPVPAKKEDNSAVQAAAQHYLDQYSQEYQALYYASAEGQWTLNTRIVEGDTTASAAAARADEAYAAFTGSSANIDSCRKYLAMKDKLLPLQVRQLEAMLFMAGNNPASAGEVVKERIDATNHQTELLYGYHYMLHGKRGEYE